MSQDIVPVTSYPTCASEPVGARATRAAACWKLACSSGHEVAWDELRMECSVHGTPMSSKLIWPTISTTLKTGLRKSA